MTKIYLHGLISKIFGKYFEIKICNAKSLIDALDANNEGFLSKMIELERSGYHYHLVIDGKKIENQNDLVEKRKIKEAHLIPAIHGFGVELVVIVLVQIAMAAAQYFISNHLARQALPPQQYIATGGQVGSVSQSGRSYVFSNRVNPADQGSPVPIGYGRMVIGSPIVFSSIKSFSTNVDFKVDILSYARPTSFSDLVSE